MLQLRHSPALRHPSPTPLCFHVAQIGSVDVAAAPDSLFPAVGMHSLGEEVLLDLNAEWGMDEDDGQMIVDSHEEDWGRLHDVRVTGTVSPGRTERFIIFYW